VNQPLTRPGLAAVQVPYDQYRFLDAQGRYLIRDYRLSKIRQQDLMLQGEAEIESGHGMGTGKAKDKKEEFLSQLISQKAPYRHGHPVLIKRAGKGDTGRINP